MKVLAIGNSFSEDATYYLHQIAAADGVDMRVVNLYIGGCGLERHWRNIVSDAPDYLLEENGRSTDRYVSIAQAVAMDAWDVIVTQQASPDSGLPETYHPWLERLAGWLRERAPRAELLLHQTWAYEIDSLHPDFPRYGQDQREMYRRLSEAYREAAAAIGARLIPCGDAVQALRRKPPFLYERGGMSLCRDGFHMNVIYGRYLLAATWYRALTGRPVASNAYMPRTSLAPHAPCREELLRVVRETVDSLAL